MSSSHTLSSSDASHCHWQSDWSRYLCVTMAQIHTGHSLLLASYIHRIGHQDSATCPHCNGAEEAAEHLFCNARHMTTFIRRCALTSKYHPTQDASVSAWRGSGQWLSPWLGMRETEREYNFLHNCLLWQLVLRQYVSCCVSRVSFNFIFVLWRLHASCKTVTLTSLMLY